MRPATARIGLLAGVALLAACAPAPAPVEPLSGPPGADADIPGRRVEPLPERPGARADTPGPVPACSPEGIRIVELGVNAAMGLRAMGLELVNCGEKPYELNGYPAVRLRDPDGDPVRVRIIAGATGITSGFDHPPARIVLAPGERAGAALVWRNLVTDPTVVATEGARLDVAPVSGRPAYPVAMTGTIDLGNTGRLGVSAWERRDTGRATGTPAPQGPPSPVTSPVDPV
ncbi:DUF4232 domain-containing protein [Micromonospora sp. DT31]|uniref:DUF4232 domain-containing protein n=1 Tax=Micromonospora sp. DT31 TaxID=3393434 RepID=UPI003CFA9855